MKASVYDDPEVQKAIPFATQLREGISNARARPVSPVYPQISQAIYENVNAALSGQVSPEEALKNAMVEWPNGGMKFPKQDIKSPLDFEQMAKLVRPEDFEGRMLITSDLDAHRAEIQRYVDMGFDRIYLHNVGRNQAEWAKVFGEQVLPKLNH